METVLPTITIAIPTFLRDPYLRQTIEQLTPQMRPGDELIIVDQTLTHESEFQEFLTNLSLSKRLRWLKQQTPSLTKARNAALQEAHCQIVLFLDDDVIIPDRFLDAHRANYVRGGVDVVCGSCLRPDRRRAFTTRSSKDPTAAAWLLDVTYDQRIEGIPVLRGGNHSLRKSVAIAAQGYDERFIGPALYEESDFAIRLFAQGARFAYDPDCWLIHIGAPAGGCRVGRECSWAEWERSFNPLLFVFRHLHHNALAVRVLYQILRAGPLRRENVQYFWRAPRAWAAFIYAAMRAKRASSRSPLSSFAAARKEEHLRAICDG